MLSKETCHNESDRRQKPLTPDIERRNIGDRRTEIVARGNFEQYFNLYNMIYDSQRVTKEIQTLLKRILDDEIWQAFLAQEVSNDRLFQTRKNKEQLREFFRKHGIIEPARRPDEKSG